MPSGRLSRVCSLNGHEERVWRVAWRPNVKFPQLASCGQDRVVRIWGHQAGTELDSENGWALLCVIDMSDRHHRTLRSLSWNANGELLAVASFDATTSLWREVPQQDREQGGLNFECVRVVEGHENEVKAAAFSPSGNFLATCSRDKSVYIHEYDNDYEYECLALLQSHTQDVKMVKWHPDQDILFSCSYDNTVKIWGPDGDDWSCKETLEAHESTVWGISFDAKGACFATCSDDCTIQIWVPESSVAEADLESNNGKHSSNSSKEKRNSVALAAYLTPLFRSANIVKESKGDPATNDATTASHPTISWHVPADASCHWRVQAKIQGEHHGPVYAVDWLPFTTAKSGTLLASASGDNHIRVFQPQDEATLETWSCVADIDAHVGDANCVAWCPTPLPNGGALLASGGDDAEIILWRFDG